MDITIAATLKPLPPWRFVFMFVFMFVTMAWTVAAMMLFVHMKQRIHQLAFLRIG
jgi:hypothetical protein